MDSRRILITGLSSWWGGRLAQALEREPEVDAVIGVDASDPKHALERTEFVRVQTEPGVLGRIINAAEIDTVIDTRLIADPLVAPLSEAREINVAGTRSLLEACASPSVRKLIFKSSAHFYGSAAEDPAFFSEDMRQSAPPATALQRDVVQAESELSDFAARNPATTVTVLRFADVLIGEPGSSHLTLLNLPAVPSIIGFDPRIQFVHEDDVIAAFSHAVVNRLTGTFNVAADGVLALSEVVSLLGKPLLPILPPWGVAFAATQLRRLGLRVPVELVRELRYGRGLDNRRLKATGFTYHYTSRETVLKLRAHHRLRPLLQSGEEEYRYDREVEEFLRRSPSVRATRGGRETRVKGDGFTDGLTESELIEAISSLDVAALSALHSHEMTHARRERVLAALERNLERLGADTAADGDAAGSSDPREEDRSRPN